MRLQSHPTGIAAIPALFAVAAAAAETTAPAVQYGNGFYGSVQGAPQKAVFTTAPSQGIDFAVRPGIAVNGVTMYYNSTVLALHSGAPTVPAGASPENSNKRRVEPLSDTHATSAASAAAPAGQGQGAKSTSTAASWAMATGSQTLAVAAPSTLPQKEDVTVSVVFDAAVIVNSNFHKLVYFKVDWTDDTGRLGSTESQDLVFVKDDTYDEGVAAASQLPAAAAQTETTITATGSTSASASKTDTATTTTANTAKTTASSSAAAAAAMSQSSKGLASGAIAGIVVGIIALIAIAGIAAFFFMRRRKNANTPAGGYRGSGSEQIGLQSGFASAAVVEKDGFGGAGAHSPYTDEASNYMPAPAAVPAPAPAPAPPVAPPVAPPAPKQPAAPAVSNQVAALIEDHMTPDEIARLAAEEEELDAAIAKAHRSRQASQA